MNSQQELLDAINAISQKQDRSCDTPATVLRVEDDTVWVHIDGGADETPVRKTINCEHGEVVQVRISNGSAFLVGNASAPPTDDKTANEARFVAIDADEKATKAIESVEAIEQTVVGKVDSGDSGIHVLSSTMLQNASGVNIYNGTLAAGDSYAHIDGDEFCIREVTTAGIIDDANDTVVASFGREVTIGSRASGQQIGDYSQVIGHDCIADGIYSQAFGYECHVYGDYSHAEGNNTSVYGHSSHAEGYYSEVLAPSGINCDGAHAEGVYTVASNFGAHAEGGGTQAIGYSAHAEGYDASAGGDYSHAQNFGTLADSEAQTAIGKYNISDANDTYTLIVGNGTESARSDALRVDWSGNVLMDGEVKNLSGNRKYVAEPSSEGTNGQVLTTDGNGGRSWTTPSASGPTILTSTTISAATTSYTFSDASITVDSVIDIYDTIFGFAPTGCTVSAGSCTITFPAQSSTHNIKLFVY